MTSTDALILDLSADLEPVQRRRIWREGCALAGLGAAELVLLLELGAMRPDMARMIVAPFMIWKIASLAVLAVAAGVVALRSFAPFPSTRRELVPVLVLAGLVVLAGAFVTVPSGIGHSLIDRLSPTRGLMCATAIVLLASPLLATMGIFMRRAAPVNPSRSAIATGLAASTFGALIFTACCPMNDPLYVVVWYSLGIAAATAVARWLLPRRFRL